MRFERYSPVTQSIERASRLGGQATDFRRPTMKKTYEKPALVKAGSFRKLTGLAGLGPPERGPLFHRLL
jgi:Family of unknown function (DUF5972)